MGDSSTASSTQETSRDSKEEDRQLWTARKTLRGDQTSAAFPGARKHNRQSTKQTETRQWVQQVAYQLEQQMQVTDWTKAPEKMLKRLWHMMNVEGWWATEEDNVADSMVILKQVLQQCEEELQWQAAKQCSDQNTRSQQPTIEDWLAKKQTRGARRAEKLSTSRAVSTSFIMNYLANVGCIKIQEGEKQLHGKLGAEFQKHNVDITCKENTSTKGGKNANAL
eukprot:c16769_g1_i2 orf=98-766(+)